MYLRLSHIIATYAAGSDVTFSLHLDPHTILWIQVGSPDVASFLGSCQHPDGGFGGGPQQLPHLAPTYAAVAALADLGQPAALAVIDRSGALAFVQRMAVPSEQGGGFRVCDGARRD